MTFVFLATTDFETSQEHYLHEEKKQAELKVHFDSFPDIDTAFNKISPDIKKAEEFTKSILNKIPSGIVTERDTACHILSQLLKNENQQCLFYDSKNGINLQDASGNLVDIGSQEKPFVLKLRSSAGLGGRNNPKTERDDLKLAEAINDAIKRNVSHPVIEDIATRLGQAYGVDKKCIVIQSVYAGSFSVVYTVLNLAQTIVQNVQNVCIKLKNQFSEFVSAKIHPLLYRPAFDISFFDERGNKTFSNQSGVHQVGPPGRTKPYTQPPGWTRYGLKVLGKYESGDWLDPFQHPGNWYRAYHGTGRAQKVDFNGSNAPFDQKDACVDALASIFETGFRTARVAAFGPGVYCSPNPIWLGSSAFVGAVQINTTTGNKTFKCMFQVAVNPNGVNCASNDIWVVPKSHDIRPYGILIKET